MRVLAWAALLAAAVMGLSATGSAFELGGATDIRTLANTAAGSAALPTPTAPGMPLPALGGMAGQHRSLQRWANLNPSSRCRYFCRPCSSKSAATRIDRHWPETTGKDS